MNHQCSSCNSNSVIEFFADKSKSLSCFFCEACTLVFVINGDSDVIPYEDRNQPSPEHLEHIQSYAQEMIQSLDLHHKSMVVEIDSRDGSQLNLFKENGIPCIGFERMSQHGADANENKINTIKEYFGVEQAWSFLSESHPQSQGRKADLVIVHNALTKVQDINDLLEGIALILKESGTATFESVWIKYLFDEESINPFMHATSFFSTHALQVACSKHDLEITDVQYFDLNGGMLRWFVQRKGLHMVSPNLTVFLGEEVESGMTDKDLYLKFGELVTGI